MCNEINLSIDEKIMWKRENLVLRKYEPRDDDGCKDLERTGSMGGRKIFFDGNFIHKKSFICKASQYGEYEVLVVEDLNDKSVAGAICVAFKEVFLNEKKVKLGYIFDLRISGRHQRKRLGTILSTAAEQLSWGAHNADFLYLTVNDDNAKAICLYEKQQFKLISVRSPATVILAFELDITKCDDFMETNDAGEAFSWYTENWDSSKEDFALTDGLPLFNSPYFIRSLMLNDGISSAGMSLWDGGGLTSFCVTKVLFPTWIWANPFVQLLGFSSLAAAVISCARCFFTASSTSSYSCMAGSAVGTLALGFCLLTAVRLFTFLKPRLRGNDTKLRGRLFAPFCKGPRGKEYLERVHKYALSYAKKDGFIVAICNLDVNHPLRDSFGYSKFRTKFYGKSRDGQEISPLNSLNFHDPRDL